MPHIGGDFDRLDPDVNDRADGYDYPPEVRFEIQQKDVEDYRAAADELKGAGRKVTQLALSLRSGIPQKTINKYLGQIER